MHSNDPRQYRNKAKFPKARVGGGAKVLEEAKPAPKKKKAKKKAAKKAD